LQFRWKAQSLTIIICNLPEILGKNKAKQLLQNPSLLVAMQPKNCEIKPQKPFSAPFVTGFNASADPAGRLDVPSA
jgi:hypothetical protein